MSHIFEFHTYFNFTHFSGGVGVGGPNPYIRKTRNFHYFFLKRKAEFDDLDKVDILKFATLIRDPLTMEINVPFETHPSKSDDMRNLAWQKIHQDAIKHFLDFSFNFAPEILF